MTSQDLPRNSDGTLASYAWPGGYPIFYIVADSACLCSDCANGKNGSLASPDSEDKQWRITAADVNYEDDSLYCDHCSVRIESAYED